MATYSSRSQEGLEHLTPEKQAVINAHLVRIIDIIAQSSASDVTEIVLAEKFGEIFDKLTDFTTFQTAVVEARIAESDFLRILGISDKI